VCLSVGMALIGEYIYTKVYIYIYMYVYVYRCVIDEYVFGNACWAMLNI